MWVPVAQRPGFDHHRDQCADLLLDRDPAIAVDHAPQVVGDESEGALLSGAGDVEPVAHNDVQAAAAAFRWVPFVVGEIRPDHYEPELQNLRDHANPAT